MSGAVLRAAISLGIHALPSRKVAATRAVYRAAGLARSPAEVETLVAANLHFTAGYYRRALWLGDAVARHRLQATIEPLHGDRLVAVTGRGRGAILASVHLGDFDLAGSWLAQVLGARFVVPVGRVRSATRQRFYDRTRRCCGFTLRSERDVRLPALAEDLRGGGLVVTMLDRRPAGATVPVSFFGRPARVSVAPAVLSTRTGAPILPSATWTDAAGVRRLWFGDPCVPGGTSKSDAAAVTQQLVAALEWAVRQAPAQWHVPAQVTQLPWA